VGIARYKPSESDVRDKLCEATYFFEQMKKTDRQKDVFRYNLSAFLSSLCSVVEFTKGRFKRVGDFDDWFEMIEPHPSDRMYKKKQQRIKTNFNIILFLHEQRRETNHVRPVLVNVREEEHYIGVQINFTPVLWEAYQPSVRWVFDDLPDGLAEVNDVVLICQDRLAGVEQHVRDAEERYGSLV